MRHLTLSTFLATLLAAGGLLFFSVHSSEAATADYEALGDYDFGKSRQALSAIEQEIRSLPSTGTLQVEKRLLDVLNRPQASFAAKQFVCRMLRRVGSARCVPDLAELLGDAELSHMARFALQHLPTPEAGAALRAALATLEGDLRVGVIGSLGLREDRQAVDRLAPLVTSTDQDTASAAIKALGRIGGREAAQSLATVNIPAALAASREDSLLMCADSLLAEGQRDRAVAIYREMAGEDHGTWIRIAAYRGLVQAEPTRAVPSVLALLRDDNLDFQRAGAKLVHQMPGSALTLALAEQLATLDARGRALLLSALDSRGDRAALPYVVKTLEGADPQVRLAAIEALGTLGDGTSVAAIAQASTGSPAARRAAQESLGRISGPGVTAALVAVAQSHLTSRVRVTVIESLVDRHASDAVPQLCDLAEDSDAQVRGAVISALGKLAGPGEIPLLVDLLLTTSHGRDRPAIERAMVSIAARTRSVQAAPLVAGLERAEGEATAHLVAVLATVGSDAALTAAREQLLHEDPNVRKAAVRALSQWPNAAPLADLMAIASAVSDPTQRVLALRGYIHLVSRPANRSAARTVALLEEAMEVAQRVEERRSILSVLADHPCKEALALAQKAAQDRALGPEAAIALKKIDEQLTRQGLTAKASRNSRSAKNVLDGQGRTRWTTGRGMKPGDWFVLDLGVESTVRGITLDTRNSRNDYPRGYEVFASFDGGQWGAAIVTGKGTSPLTEIRFGSPVKTRYFKILQTGSSDSWNWSIHELSVEFD